MQTAEGAAGRWLRIIGALLLALALGSCSTNRLAYNQAPTLVYYWLDSYFDWDGPQSTALKSSLQSLHSWHRTQELPQLATLLKNLQPTAQQDTTPEQVCSLWAALQQRLQVPVVQLLPTLGKLSATLTPAQLQHIEVEFKKRNQRWRAEWLEVAAAERITRRSQQITDRAEQLYGRLDAPQRALIRAQVAASSYDPEIQHQEMLRRQQDSLQTLARLRSQVAGGDAALAPALAQSELQALMNRALQPPDAAVRAYAEGVTRAGCAMVAVLHNSSSPAQRAHLQDTLQDYEADAQALMAAR